MVEEEGYIGIICGSFYTNNYILRKRINFVCEENSAPNLLKKKPQHIYIFINRNAIQPNCAILT